MGFRRAADVTIDALAGADVLPFWQAVLGYRQIEDDYLADPLRRGPGLGLQRMDSCAFHRSGHQRSFAWAFIRALTS